MSSITPRESRLSVNESFSVTVDGSKSIEEMLRAGNYYPEWTDYERISSKNFPVTRSGIAQVEIKMTEISDRSIPAKEIYEELDYTGMRGIDIHELLAFGAQYPNPQETFDELFALGSTWRGKDGLYRAPVLKCGGMHTKRSVELSWIEAPSFAKLAWSSRGRFGAVVMIPSKREIASTKKKLSEERKKLEEEERNLRGRIQNLKNQEEELTQKENYELAQALRKNKGLPEQTYAEWRKEDFDEKWEYEKSMRERS